MSQYLLAVHTQTSDGAPAEPTEQQPSPEAMQEMMGRMIALEAEMEGSGAFAFSGRLADPDAATVVRSNDGEMAMTDGPFVEAKEHIAGFYIINAEDLDEALAWAGKVTECVGAPIEVRPFTGTGKVADQMPEMPGS